MIKRIKQLIIIAVVFTLAMPTVILAESPPMPPIIVSGAVTIDGEIASSGTVSVEDGEITTPIIANISNGRYSILVPFENNGKELTFKVNDKDATSQIVTSPTQEIDLAIITPEDTPDTPDTPPDTTITIGTSVSARGSGTTSGGNASASTPSDIKETPKTPAIKGVTDVNILDGDIVQCASSDNPFAVYIVKIVGDTKYIRHIVSLEIFNYYGHLKWENLKQVESLDEYSLSGWVRVNTGQNGTPGPTDKVYEINGDQTKHWINMTAEDFLSHGGSEPAIYSVNQGELNLYTTGVDVMSL